MLHALVDRSQTSLFTSLTQSTTNHDRRLAKSKNHISMNENSLFRIASWLQQLKWVAEQPVLQQQNSLEHPLLQIEMPQLPTHGLDSRVGKDKTVSDLYPTIYLAEYQFWAHLASTDRSTCRIFLPSKGLDMHSTTMALASKPDSVGPSRITSSWTCFHREWLFQLMKTVSVRL